MIFVSQMRQQDIEGRLYFFYDTLNISLKCEIRHLRQQDIELQNNLSYLLLVCEHYILIRQI